MPLAAARLASLLSIMVSGFVCAARAAFSEMSDKQLENQTKRSVSLRPPMHPRLCCKSNSSALPTQSCKRGGDRNLSCRLARTRQKVDKTSRKCPAAVPAPAPEHTASISEGNFSCAQLHRARQCHVFLPRSSPYHHVRIVAFALSAAVCRLPFASRNF